jgi:hypothetical protein
MFSYEECVTLSVYCIIYNPKLHVADSIPLVMSMSVHLPRRLQIKKRWAYILLIFHFKQISHCINMCFVSWFHRVFNPRSECRKLAIRRRFRAQVMFVNGLVLKEFSEFDYLEH